MSTITIYSLVTLILGDLTHRFFGLISLHMLNIPGGSLGLSCAKEKLEEFEKRAKNAMSHLSSKSPGRWENRGNPWVVMGPPCPLQTNQNVHEMRWNGPIWWYLKEYICWVLFPLTWNLHDCQGQHLDYANWKIVIKCQQSMNHTLTRVRMPILGPPCHMFGYSYPMFFY